MTELVDDAQGLGPRGPCRGGVAGVVLGFAEVGEAGGFAAAVAAAAEQVEGLPAVRESLVMVADLNVAPAEMVEGGGLPRQVVDRPIVVEAALGVVTCLPVVPVGRVGPAQPVMGQPDAMRVRLSRTGCREAWLRGRHGSVRLTTMWPVPSTRAG
jgi:hypothetical protein